MVLGLAFITETWLNDNIDDAAVHIPNYSVARRDRVSRTGGGVCAFVKSYIPFKVLSYMMTILRHFGYISDHINYFEDFRV